MDILVRRSLFPFLLTPGLLILGCGDDDTSTSGAGGGGGAGGGSTSSPASTGVTGATTSSSATTGGPSSSSSSSISTGEGGGGEGGEGGEGGGETGAGGSGGQAEGGGGAGGGETFCAPRSQRACYTGPDGTQGVGECAAGLETCLEDGSAYGACEGETVPATETCLTEVDDDCDGEVNEEGEGCVCVPGTTIPCYAGPDGTEGVGICTAGTQTCDALGLEYEACVGEVLPGVEDCATVEDDDCDGEAPFCPGATVWARRAGAASNQSARAVATDADGNVIVVGQFAGTLDLGGGPLTSSGGDDVFVAKLAPDGSHLWSTRFGDDSEQRADAVAVDASGNVVVAGTFEGTIDAGGGPIAAVSGDDLFVVKLDADGAHQWSQGFGAAGVQQAAGVAVDADGAVILTGVFSGTFSFGGSDLSSPGALDPFVAKLDASGVHVWSQSFSGSLDQHATAVAVDAAGGVVVVGRFAGTFSAGGDDLTAVGVDDMFVARLDAAGAHVWSDRYGDGALQTASAVAIDSLGGVVVTGHFGGTLDFGGDPLTTSSSVDYDAFVVSLDAAGAHLWSARFGDAAAQQLGVGVATASDGSVTVTGTFGGTIDLGGGTLTSLGGDDVFIARLDDEGAHVRSRAVGGTSAQRPGGVAVDPDGFALVAGLVSSTVDFGGGPVPSGGGADVFVLKLAP